MRQRICLRSAKFGDGNRIEMTPLEPGFQPTKNDIICARGRTAYNHEGNQVFRGILAENLEKYQTASTKQQKTSVVNALVEEIKEQSRFVRKLSDGKWVEVAEHVAKEKIGQGFRDLLHTQYRSSTKSKVKLRRERRRRQKNQEEHGSLDSEVAELREHSESFEPLPLDETAEALLYDCGFTFADKNEERIAEGEVSISLAKEEPKMEAVEESKSGVETAAMVEEAMESSSVPVPTFVSPASPSPRGQPRPHHSPEHHNPSPEAPQSEWEQYHAPQHQPGPPSRHSPSVYPYRYPWRHQAPPYSPPVDYRSHATRHFQYYPPHHHPPSPPRRAGAGWPPYTYAYHGAHRYPSQPAWSDYYHPPPPREGGCESVAPELGREGHHSGNGEHRYPPYPPPGDRSYGPP